MFYMYEKGVLHTNIILKNTRVLIKTRHPTITLNVYL